MKSPVKNIKWFSPLKHPTIKADNIINKTKINNRNSPESDDDDEEADNVDMNYPLDRENQLNNDQFLNDESQNKNQQNMSNNFHKIGTMLNNKIRKISVAEQNKRNSNFQSHQTQLVIENLSPFIVNTNMKNCFRNEPQSPKPKDADNLRPFSPYNVSEFDEGDITESKARNTSSRILGQFIDQRKAVSPNFRPIEKDFRGIIRNE